MDDTNFLPNDVTECHRLLVAAYKQSLQLEQQAVDAKHRAAESEQEVAELNRAIEESAVPRILARPVGRPTSQ